MKKAATRAVLDRARQASHGWGRLSVHERIERLHPLIEALASRTDEVVALICEENGKPPVEALGHEVLPSLANLRYLLESAYRRGHAPPIEAVSEADALSKTAATQGAVTAVPGGFVDETVRPVAIVD